MIYAWLLLNLISIKISNTTGWNMTNKHYLLSASAAILLVSSYVVSSSSTTPTQTEIAQINKQTVIETDYTSTSKTTQKKSLTRPSQQSTPSQVNIVNDSFTSEDVKLADVPATTLFVENLYIPKHRKQDEKLSFLKAKKGLKGTSYYSYQQQYKGLDVYGAEVIAQISPTHDLQSVTGRYSSNLEIDTTASLDGQDALTQTLESISNGDSTEQRVYENPELLVYVDYDETPSLAYKAVAKYADTQGALHIEQLFIDANSGELLNAVTRIHSAKDIDIYELTRCLGNGGTLPGTEKRSSDTAVGNTQVDNAYEYLDDSYWFYKKVFNRDSYDLNGARIVATVNATFRGQNSYSCNGMNAFFTSDDKQLIFGKGDSSTNPFSSAPDVVAHELTHAVTWKESNLEYKNESGALNESISDIFGVTVQAWAASGGSDTNNPDEIEIASDTWQLGEKLGNESFIRYMDNPTKDGRSPDNYDDRKTGSDDNGGVHSNSGITNLSYTLLAGGGTHPKNETTVEVPAIGINKAISIWYEAQTNLLSTRSDYSVLRSKLASAATALYGECSAEYKATQLSMDAVKMPGEWECAVVDSEAPTVASVNPVDNATGIELSQAVSITMNEAIDADSVTTSTVTLSSENGSNVDASVVLNSTDKIVITPSTELEHETKYILTVSTGVKDVAGNALESSYVSNFTTIDAPAPDTQAPSLVDYSLNGKTDAVAISSQYIFEFDEALDASSINSNSITLSDASGNAVAIGVSYNSNKITINPSADLEYNTNYKLVLSKDITDVAGNNLEYSITINYTTIEASQTDTTAPEMLTSDPQNSATDVDVSKVITLSFNEALSVASITSQNVTLKDASSNSVSATISYENKVITITPAQELEYATTYSLHVSTAVSDIFDNALSSALNLSFTTENAPAGSAEVPTITTASPTANAVVATNVRPSVSFSIAMEESSLLSALTLSANGNSVSGSVSLNANTATFTPSSLLAADTTYTLTVSKDAQSGEGVALENVYTTTFKTEAEVVDTPSTNPLADATLRSSSQYSNGYSVENVRDGEQYAWFSKTNNSGYFGEEWIQIDLKSATTIQDVTVDWDEFYYAREIEVLVLVNGNWSRLGELRKYNSADSVLPINQKVSSIYIGMRGGYYGGWFGITEITLH